jgi:hypothetical protein
MQDNIHFAQFLIRSPSECTDSRFSAKGAKKHSYTKTSFTIYIFCKPFKWVNTQLIGVQISLSVLMHGIKRGENNLEQIISSFFLFFPFYVIILRSL